MFHNKEWGTVCDDGWDIKNAQVVCRMLNFTSALAAPTALTFGGGKVRIWLDDVRCTGNENALSECRHSRWGSHNCDHSEDVGVICGPLSCKYTPSN